MHHLAIERHLKDSAVEQNPLGCPSVGFVLLHWEFQESVRLTRFVSRCLMWRLSRGPPTEAVRGWTARMSKNRSCLENPSQQLDYQVSSRTIHRHRAYPEAPRLEVTEAFDGMTRDRTSADPWLIKPPADALLYSQKHVHLNK